MKIAIFCLIIPAIFANPPRPNGITGKIVNGAQINIAQSVHSLYLEIDMNSNCYVICGGSILSPKFAITAAHCTVQPNVLIKDLACTQLQSLFQQLFQGFGINFDTVAPPSAIKITGQSTTHSTSDGGVGYTAAAVYQNPDYNAATFNNDISLIKINGKFQPTPIPLAPKGSDLAPGTTCYSAGWGLESGSATALSPTLKQATLYAISRATCAKSFSGLSITNQMNCAGNTNDATCQGDSGSSFICNGYLYGVTSFGISGCSPSNPSVFANVADPAMRSFIDKYNIFA